MLTFAAVSEGISNYLSGEMGSTSSTQTKVADRVSAIRGQDIAYYSFLEWGESESIWYTGH